MKPALVLAMTALAAPTVAGADQTLSFRGGLAGSLQQHPYAIASSTGLPVIDEIAESNYGTGGLVSLTYGISNVFNDYGLEASLSFVRLDGDDAFGEPAPGPGTCTPNIFDVLTLSHGVCTDGAEVSNTATSMQARALGTRTVSYFGTQVLAGVGILSFQNDIDGMMFYPGEFSVQTRETDFLGAGLVLGVRYDLPVSDTWDLGLEGFSGVFRGERELRIQDNYQGTVGTLDLNEDVTVYSLDVAVSLEREVDFFDRNGSISMGVSYNTLFGVVDTANYGVNFPTSSSSPTGNVNDDFNAFSLFAGYTLAF